MNYLVLVALVVAVLACPVLMCGPMLLRQIGLKLRRGESPDRAGLAMEDRKDVVKHE